MAIGGRSEGSHSTSEESKRPDEERGWQRSFHTRPTSASAALSALSHVILVPSSSSSAPARMMNHPPALRYPPLLAQLTPPSVLPGRQARLSLALSNPTAPVPWPCLPSYVLPSPQYYHRSLTSNAPVLLINPPKLNRMTHSRDSRVSDCRGQFLRAVALALRLVNGTPSMRRCPSHVSGRRVATAREHSDPDVAEGPLSDVARC